MRQLVACLLMMTIGLSLSAHASDPVQDAIHKLDPTAKITSEERGPLPDLVTVIVNSQPLYISTDGRYVIQGQLYDLQRSVNVTAAHQADQRVIALKAVPQRDRITFTPPHVKYHITAFVDIECGYCHQMMNNLDGYLAQGIQIDFLAFPRAGLDTDSFREAVAVWCAADPRWALRSAYTTKPAVTKPCKNPVAMELKLSEQLNIVGTPGVIADDGTVLGGFLSPTEMRKRLDEKQASAATKSR